MVTLIIVHMVLSHCFVQPHNNVMMRSTHQSFIPTEGTAGKEKERRWVVPHLQCLSLRRCQARQGTWQEISLGSDEQWLRGLVMSKLPVQGQDNSSKSWLHLSRPTRTLNGMMIPW